MSEKTQATVVLNWMKNHPEGITTSDAFRYCGVTNLHKVIARLEQQGYEISREWRNGKNRYGEKCVYKRYRLVSNG